MQRLTFVSRVKSFLFFAVEHSIVIAFITAQRVMLVCWVGLRAGKARSLMRQPRDGELTCSNLDIHPRLQVSHTPRTRSPGFRPCQYFAFPLMWPDIALSPLRSLSRIQSDHMCSRLLAGFMQNRH